MPRTTDVWRTCYATEDFCSHNRTTPGPVELRFLFAFNHTVTATVALRGLICKRRYDSCKCTCKCIPFEFVLITTSHLTAKLSRFSLLAYEFVGVSKIQTRQSLRCCDTLFMC